MKNNFVIAGGIVLLLFLFQGVAFGQNTAANGDFQLQDQGAWEKNGNNIGVGCIEYDTNGNGQKSWCWKRKPGDSPFGGGNGGITQEVCLVGGVTYKLTANICYHADC